MLRSARPPAYAPLVDKTPAILIRQVDFSESSRIATFYTRADGKLGMMAKGGRRQKNAFDSSLDLLTQADLVYIRKENSLSLLTEAKLSRRFRPPDGDVAALYAGYYVAELLDGLTEEGDPNEELFDAACETLDLLMAGASRAKAVSRFELRLLREVGHLPSFDSCLRCGAEVDPAGGLMWGREGGVLCPRCRTGGGGTRLSAATLRAVETLAGDDPAAIDALSIDRQQLGELRSVLGSTVQRVLERKPKMARYLSFRAD